MGNDQDYVLLLTNAEGQKKLAAWTLREAHQVRLRLGGKSAGTLTIVKCLGDRSPALEPKNELILGLTAGPQYVTIGEAVVSED